jgi:hypothetical protein
MENKSTNEIVSELIGDTPVSVQLNTVIDTTVNKEEFQTLKNEIFMLRKKIEHIAQLVGDTSVSEQINNAIQSVRG